MTQTTQGAGRAEYTLIMRTRWLLIGLVVGVAVLGEAAIAWMTETPDRRGHLLMPLVLTMPLSHGSLLAFWAALGGRATPWRLVAAVMGITGWMWVLERFAFDRETQLSILLALLLMGLLSLLLMTARFFGLELTDIQAADVDQPPPPDGRWGQFSLRSLFSWMTAAAMMLGALHYLPKQTIDRSFTGPPLVFVVTLFAAILGGSALIALSAVWLTLATRWTAMRYLVLVLAGAVAILPWIPPFGRLEPELLTMCLGQVFWTAGSLWLVRLAGYRLIWRRRVRL